MFPHTGTRIEEIVTVQVEYPYHFGNLQITWTEDEHGVVSNLVGRGFNRNAVINGTPCVPGRLFTKESLQKCIDLVLKETA